MFHRAFIALTRLIANTFFRRVDIAGLENVPQGDPLIFACNHPKVLMDGFLLNVSCGRWPLHFLTCDQLWKYKLLDVTGAVPVYRRDDHGDQKSPINLVAVFCLVKGMIHID